MYTSGWPNSQNRCCQSTGSPPLDGLKKLLPKFRSNISRNRAIVMTGRAKSSRNWVISPIHVKTGIRNRPMPGARMLRHVTIRFTAPTVEAMPVMSSPPIQKSMLCPGENTIEVFGA